MTALSGVAAAALAVAGLALTSPTSAASAGPAAPAAPAKNGYTGAPANPAPYTVTQPDGSTLQVRAFGDRLANGVATVQGNYTVVKGADGYWRYAAGLTAAGKLKPSSVIAGQGAAPAAAKGLAPVPSGKAVRAETPPAGTGDDKQLTILVQFSDRLSVGSTEAQWAAHYFGATGSVDDFYDEASQGVFGVVPAAESCGTANNGVTNWLTLPYAHPNTGVEDAPEDYIADAIELAGGCVDFASFDTNGDDDLTTDELHITVIGAGQETSYAGPGNTCGDGPSIWGHQWDLGSAQVDAPVVDGVTVGNGGYTTFGEWHCAADEQADDTMPAAGHKATIGIMSHEFGHDINWPDLYDTDQSGEGVGVWSLMGSGSWGTATLPGDSPSHPDAFSLYYQGWVTPTVATAVPDIAVDADEVLLLGPNPNGVDWSFNDNAGTGEYFLLENRTEEGYDASTPGCGIVIYRIDETVTPSNGANADETDPLVKVMQADGLEELENGVDRGDAGDPWPGTTNKHEFDNTSTPNTRFHDGTPSNLDLHVDENACAPTMHVDVTQVGGASPVPVPPANDNFASAVTLTGNSGTVTGNNEHATMETGEPEAAGVGEATIWYRWTPTSSGNATITMAGSDFDTVLGVFTGSAVNGLTLVADNDDEDFPVISTSKVVTRVTGGTTYRIAAAGYDGDSGTVRLAWSLVADPVPPKLATTTTAKAPKKVKFKKNFDVTATVAASGGTATGTVQVFKGSKLLGTGTLANGVVKIKIKKNLKPGKHTLTVKYSGSTTTNASETTVKVKVKKKKRKHRN